MKKKVFVNRISFSINSEEISSFFHHFYVTLTTFPCIFPLINLLKLFKSIKILFSQFSLLFHHFFTRCNFIFCLYKLLFAHNKYNKFCVFVKYLLYDSIVLIRKLIFKSKNCHGKFVYRKVFQFFLFLHFILLSLDEEIRFAGNLFWISFTLFRVVFFFYYISYYDFVKSEK